VIESKSLKRVRISLAEREAYGLRPNEIVINRVNSREYLGKSALITQISEPTVFESNMMRVAVDAGVLDPVYTIHFLQTRFLKEQVLRAAKDAVNQSSINQQDVKALLINVPPLKLQQQYADRVGAISRLKSAKKDR
jgi:type I restriction enzyme, S subunit